MKCRKQIWIEGPNKAGSLMLLRIQVAYRAMQEVSARESVSE